MAEIINPHIKLAECPFCHEIGLLFREQLWDDSHGYYGKYEYYVCCDNNECGVRPKTRTSNDVYGDKKDAIQKVIKRWNSR